MEKQITSAKDADDFSVGFDRHRVRSQCELVWNKSIRGKYHVIIMLKNDFAFAEHQQKATYGLGYKLTLTTKKDDAVLKKAEAIANARIKLDNIHWYVPHYTPSIPQQGMISKQILSKTSTELRCIERPVSMKKVRHQNLSTFKSACQESMNTPIWFLTGFQQQDGNKTGNF